MSRFHGLGVASLLCLNAFPVELLLDRVSQPRSHLLLRDFVIRSTVPRIPGSVVKSDDWPVWMMALGLEKVTSQAVRVLERFTRLELRLLISPPWLVKIPE